MPDAPAKIEIRGTRELARGIDRLFHDIERDAEAQFASTAAQVAMLVRSRLPRRTGRLAGTVAAHASDRGALVSMGAGLPDYAGWIEYGGGHGRPYIGGGRYLYPTSVDAAGEFKRAGDEAAHKAIRGMSWPTPTPL